MAMEKREWLEQEHKRLEWQAAYDMGRGDVCKILVGETGVRHIKSAEDPAVEYLEMPDGLRLIIRNGEYDGWYWPGEKEE